VVQPAHLVDEVLEDRAGALAAGHVGELQVERRAAKSAAATVVGAGLPRRSPRAAQRACAGVALTAASAARVGSIMWRIRKMSRTSRSSTGRTM